MPRNRLRFAFAMLCAAAVASHAATTINVTGVAMAIAVDGTCSLLEAVQAANTNSTVNECVVGGGGPPFTLELTPGGYQLLVPAQVDAFWGSSGLVIGTNDVIINGNGSTISRGAAAPPMGLMILTGGSLTLRSLGLANGNPGSPFWGGAISLHSGAVLNLQRVSATGNSADEGAVVNAGPGTTVNILDSFFGGNNAPGGGTTIRLSDANVNVANSTFNNAVGSEFAMQGPAGRTALLSNVTIFSELGYAASGATMTVNRSIMGSCVQATASTTGTLNLGTGCPGSIGPQPELLPGFWGGPTTSYALVQPNAAVDAGGACTYASAGTNPLFANGAPIAADQRGFPRVGPCDVGAFETYAISPALQVLPNATVGVPYSQVLSASGGTPGYTFALLSPSVAPPTGLTLSAAGAIAGTPTTAEFRTFVVVTTDANGFQAAHRYDITVLPAPQTITFAPVAAVNFGTAPFNVSASASSGLTVALSSITPSVCTVSGTLVTLVSAGPCTLAANQAGDANYTAAPTVTQTFSVNAVVPGAPTGVSATPGTGSAAFSFTPPSFTGGTTITSYTVACNPGALSATGPASPITVTGLASGTTYACTVSATNSAGTGAGANIGVSLAMASQAITFAPLAAKNACDPAFAVSATASSGLPVAFASQTAAVCSVAGSTVTLLGPGTCTIVATQAGNAGYLAAAPVSQSFVVSAAAAPATSGASGTGSGAISVTVMGGGGGCGRQFTLAQFLPAPPGSAPVPPTAPEGIAFPHGLFNFVLGGLVAGSSATFTITYPGAVTGMAYWKYGPTPADPTPHWYVLPATLVGNTATFTIVDGGLGDDDLVANGAIVDQGGPGIGAGGSQQTPTLSEWMLAVLAMLVMWVGMAGRGRARQAA